MKRKNADLLLKSLEALFASQDEQVDGQTWGKELGDFVWYLSVAKNEPLRVFRRLQLLSRMEHHEQDNEQVFP